MADPHLQPLGALAEEPTSQFDIAHGDTFELSEEATSMIRPHP